MEVSGGGSDFSVSAPRLHRNEETAEDGQKQEPTHVVEPIPPCNGFAMLENKFRLSPSSKGFRRTFFVYKITPCFLHHFRRFLEKSENIVIRSCPVSVFHGTSLTPVQDHEALLPVLIDADGTQEFPACRKTVTGSVAVDVLGGQAPRAVIPICSLPKGLNLKSAGFARK